jgi:hypothetical protein
MANALAVSRLILLLKAHSAQMMLRQRAAAIVSHGCRQQIDAEPP